MEIKTLAETFPTFPSVLRVIDRSDRNPPITATGVTFVPSLRHAIGLGWVGFNPICPITRARLTEILETFPRVFCLPKSRINENGGNVCNIKNLTRYNDLLYVSSCEMFTLCDVMHEKKETKQNKTRKQTLESAQYGLQIIFKRFVIIGVFNAFIFGSNRITRRNPCVKTLAAATTKTTNSIDVFVSS